LWTENPERGIPKQTACASSSPFFLAIQLLVGSAAAACDYSCPSSWDKADCERLEYLIENFKPWLDEYKVDACYDKVLTAFPAAKALAALKESLGYQVAIRFQEDLMEHPENYKKETSWSYKPMVEVKFG
jgi:hypothetical protein